ncbi:response regulator transcription factor [Caldalkalibacillus mannanilyticus]|uniref:response regulator transcription factor n=1 Tax=Caldalkalibacillus mannanilyticus TaxID=1418 RepID=UPI00046A706B|nr:response regulator transcription factor [Caldalkalibacillus mannanilyticus]
MESILIIDDDEQLTQIMTMYLEKDGYKVFWAEDGITGQKFCEQLTPSLIIMDVMLPGIDGLGLCKHLRYNQCFIPILMVSAKNNVNDRISGLEIGADDYLCKPFSMNELVVRVKTLLRRWGNYDESFSPKPALWIDSDKKKLYHLGNEVELTSTEYTIMDTFLKQQGKVFSREELMLRLRGIDHLHLTERAIDFHITNLRKKIEKDPKKPKYIKTLWGMGYQFQGGEEQNCEK